MAHWTDQRCRCRCLTTVPRRPPPGLTAKDHAMRKLTLLVLAAAAVAAFLKRQRDREFDESIWEEPQSA